MASRARDDFVQADWAKTLADKPLAEVVRAIDGVQNIQSAANCFERFVPERLDYLLYRRYVISSQYHNFTQRAHLTSKDCANLIIGSLDSDNALVAAGSRLVLTKLKEKHLKELAGAGIEALNRLYDALNCSKPVRDGFDAALCDAICIPHIKLVLREVREKRLTGNDNLYSPVAWLEPIIQEVVEAIQALLERYDLQSLGESLPIDTARLDLVTGWLPWKHKETISLLGKTLVEVGNYITSTRFDSVKEIGRDAFLHLLDQSILLVQCGWLSLRKLSEALQGKDEEVEKMQIVALAHLAELQHLRGNNILAAQYAVFALHANLAFNQFSTLWHRGRHDNTLPDIPKGALTTPQCSTMRTLANRMGLYAPGYFQDGGKRSSAGMYAELLKFQSPFDNVFARLQDVGRHWDGFDENILKFLIERFESELIPSVLEAAIRTGNMRLVLNLLEKPGRKHSVTGSCDQHRNRRNCILVAATQEIVLLYADALATVQQQAVALCYKGADSRLILRTIWKQIRPERFSIMETLFIHHVKIGFSYYGLAAHYAGRQATWALYESASPQIRNQLFSDFAGKVGARNFVPMSLAAFQKGTLSIGPDEVLISLCTREGHEASLIVCGPNGVSHDIIDSVSACVYGHGKPASQQDWHKILNKFSVMARCCIRYGMPVRPQPAVIGLAMKMIDAIRAANPNVKRIAFHGDPMFRIVPWQFIFQHCVPVRVHRVACFNTDRTSGLRTATDDGGCEFVVFHIEGVRFQSTKRPDSATGGDSPRNSGWGIRNIDPEDSYCKEIEGDLSKLRNGSYAMKSSGARLSVIAHGRTFKFASQIKAGDSVLSAEEMNENMSDYELVALHTCYGGYAENNELADIGGLPGFLLSHGCSTLFASPLPLKREEVLTLERHLSDLSNFEADAVMNAYLNAAHEDSACAFYNLYLPQRSLRLN